ncbi:MAG TPA: aminotransferase class I/II-fold pyridoxal phosphate-dependent enzyme [Chloroflexi bacterium]|nr:aminotransferase class I/II-fold pyridoxal phosphate-dependent enzyme [Chloroflexota bacterium]
MVERKKWGMSTTAVHGGYSPIPMKPEEMILFRSVTPPLIQSGIYPLTDVDHYTRMVQGLEPGYDYGRNSNPTVDILEKRLAALEGGEAALATPSGMHAVFLMTRYLTKVGDEVVTSHMIFGEAYELFYRMAPERMGVRPRLVTNPGDLKEWERQITPRTRFLWVETPSNPTLFVTDIAGVAEIAHAHNIPLIVDNTLVTPCLQHPLDLGADFVVHSLTKFMSGNGAIVGGSIVGKKERIRELRSLIACVGAILPPFNAWLALMSLETLPLRMARHSSNAEKVAEYLAQHPKVTHVNYPSLPDHPQHELAKRQMPGGFGGLLSFVVQGGAEGAIKVMESFRMIAIVPSFGTSRTIATHPATHTHCNMKPEEREAVGIYDGLIRLSVGLEDPEDIIADLEQALDQL